MRNIEDILFSKKCNDVLLIQPNFLMKILEEKQNKIVRSYWRSINNNSLILENLFKKLIENRVKPYYLHHCDLVPGTAHFRTSIDEGQSLLKKIRGRVSGICWPTYVLDIPKGYGKIPLGPFYYEKKKNGKIIVTDYKGNTHEYPNK